MDEIAGDCLHPLHSTFGTNYVAEVLIHWLGTTAHASRHRTRVARASSPAAAVWPAPSSALDASMALPPPVDRNAMQSDEDHRACYTLDIPHYGGWLGGNRAMKRSLPWYSASCPPEGCTDAQISASGRQAQFKCPNEKDRTGMKRLIDNGAPPVFFFCAAHPHARRATTRP